MGFPAWLVLAGVVLACAPARAATLDADRKDCGQSQNRDKAIVGCTGLIGRSAALGLPERALAYKNRGNAHEGKGELALAIEDYDAAIRLAPRDQELKDKRGAVRLPVDRASCLQTADRDLQIRGCSAVLAHNYMQGADDQAWAYKNRGNAYFVGKGDLDFALADVDAWIRYASNKADAYAARGDIYKAKGEVDRAIADYDVAIRLDPYNQEAKDKRIAAKLAADRASCLQTADRDLQISGCTAVLAHRDMQGADDQAWAYKNRGRAYGVGKGDLDHALADVDAWIRNAPNEADAYAGRGEIFMEKGEVDRGIADLDAAIRLNPADKRLRDKRLEAAFAKGDYDFVLAACGDSLRLDAMDKDAVNCRARAYYLKGDFARSIAEISQGTGASPADPATLADRIFADIATGNHDRALAELDQMRKAKGFNGLTVFLEEIVLWRAGQPSRLQAHIADIDDMDKGIKPIFKAWLGELSPQEVLAAVKTGNERELCETSFLLGARDIIQGDRALGLARIQCFAPNRAGTFNAEKVYKAILFTTLASAPIPAPAIKPDSTAASATAATVTVAKADPEPAKVSPAIPAAAPCASLGKRVALVVGNSAYPQAAALANPVNDANDVASLLREKLCFTVIEARDATRDAFSDRIGSFAEAAIGADVALFYYAGHGMQFEQTNYLLPIDAKLTNEYEAIHGNISAQDIISLLEARAKVTLVFLDACRSNPIEDNFRKRMAIVGRGGGSRGLAPMAISSAETLVVFATRPNQQAEDGAGRNSPFTQAFLENIATPGKDIELVMRDVAAAVRVKTNGKQTPQRLTELEHGLMLLPMR